MYLICFVMGFMTCLFLGAALGFVYLFKKWKPIVDSTGKEEEEKDTKTLEEQFVEMMNYQPRYGDD